MVSAPQAPKNPPVPRALSRAADGPTKAHTATGKGAGSVATTSPRISAAASSSPAAAAAAAVAATRRPATVSSTGKPGAKGESTSPQPAGCLAAYRPAARGSGASPERSLSSVKGAAVAPLRSAPPGARPSTGQATKATREAAVASEVTSATPASLVASSPAATAVASKPGVVPSSSSATPTSYSHGEIGRAGRSVQVSRDSSAPTSTAASAVAAVAGAASASDGRSKPTDGRRSIAGKGGPSVALDGVVVGPKRLAPREATSTGKARGVPSKAAVEETAGQKSQSARGARTNETGSMRNDRAFSEEGSAWPMSTDGAGQSRIERALTPDQPACLPRRPASATSSHQGGSAGVKGKERRNVSRVEPRAETMKPSHLSEAAASSMGNGGAAGKAGEGPAVAQHGPRARTVSPPPIGGSTLPGARSSGGNGALRGVDRPMPHPIGVQAMDVDVEVQVPPVEGSGSCGQVRDRASEGSGAKGRVSAGSAAPTRAATAPVESGRSEAGQRFPDERATSESAFGAEVTVGDKTSGREQLPGKHGMESAGHIEGTGQGVAHSAPGAIAGPSSGRQGQPPTGLRESMWFAEEVPPPAQSSSGKSSSKVPTRRATSPSDVSGSCDDDAAAAAATAASPSLSVEPVGALAPRTGPTGRLSIREASSLERPGVAPAHAQSRELEAGAGDRSGLPSCEEAEVGAETGRGARLGANGGAVVLDTETVTASAKPGATRADTSTPSREQEVDGIQRRGRAEGAAASDAAREMDPAVTATSALSFPPGSEALGSLSRARGTAGLDRELSPGQHAAPHSDDDTTASTSPATGDAAQSLAASLTKGRLGASSVPRTSDSIAGPSIGAFRPESGVTGFGSSAPRAGVGGSSVGRGTVAAATVVGAPPSSSPLGQISLAQQSQKAHDAIALRRREDELASRVAANFSFFSESGGVAEGGASPAGAGRASEAIPRGGESVREGPPSVPGHIWRPSAIISPGGGGGGGSSRGGGGGGIGDDGVLGEEEAVYKRGRQSPDAINEGIVGAVGPNPLVSRPPALRPEVGVHRRVGSGFDAYPPAYGSPPSPAASASASGVAAGTAAAAGAASAATSLPAVSFSRFRGGGYGSRFNTSHSVSARIREDKRRRGKGYTPPKAPASAGHMCPFLS